LIPIGVFVVVFGVYLYTLCPTVYWDDAGELIAACYTLGVPHPPGHPLYAILGKLFTLIPLASPAFRVNLMSAFFGALTCSILLQVVRELIQQEEESKRFADFGGVISAFCAAFSLIMWDQSIVAETTTLHTFFMLAVTLLVFRIDAAGAEDSRLTRRLLVFSFIFGLSFTNHVAGLFFAPSLACILIYRLRLRFFRPGRLIAMIVLFAVGLSVYIYLPIASRFDPAIDWGNPETLNNFLWVVTAKQYSSNLLRFPSGVIFLASLQKMGAMFLSNLTWVGILFAVIGVFRLWKTRKPVVVYGIVIILILFATSLNSAFIFAYLLPAVLMAVIWLGVGAAYLCSKAQLMRARFSRSLGRIVGNSAYCVSILLAVFLGFSHFSESNKRHYVYAHEYGRALLSSLPENAVLITGTADPLFISWYLQYCEDYRTDVKVITRNGLTRPGYLNQIRKQYPDLDIPDQFEYEGDKSIRPSHIQKKEAGLPWFADAYFRKLYELNSDKFPIFWEGIEANQLLIERFRPYEYVFYILPPGRRTSFQSRFPPSAEKIMERTGHDTATGKVYGNHFFNYGLYYHMHNDNAKAERYYEDSLKLNPHDARALNNIGSLIAERGDNEEAFERFLKAFHANPNDAASNHNIGEILLSRGNAQKAVPFFRRAIQADPGNFRDYHGLGLAYADRGNNRRAVEMLEKALKLEPESAETLASLGVAYLRLHDTKNARKFLKTAVQLDPDDAENWYNMACLQVLENDISGSSDSLKKALSLNHTAIYDLASKDPRLSPVLDSLSESE